MAQLKTGRMQRLARQHEPSPVFVRNGVGTDLQIDRVVRPVQLVSQQRKPEREQRGANLVEPPGFGNGPHHAELPARLLRAEKRPCRLDLHSSGGRTFPGDEPALLADRLAVSRTRKPYASTGSGKEPKTSARYSFRTGQEGLPSFAATFGFFAAISSPEVSRSSRFTRWIFP